MLKIENSTDINAPIEHVWQVLIDRDQYPQWNPVILQQQGVLQRGCSASMRIKPGLFPMNVKIIYRQVNKHTELSWYGGPPLVKGFHYFRLQKISNKQTRLVHGEEFGWLAALLSWLPIITLVKNAYRKSDDLFKIRCESLLDT